MEQIVFHALTRRSFLQVGYSGLLGLGLSSLSAPRARANETRTPKSIIIVFLTGAPSHLDTFDHEAGRYSGNSGRVFDPRRRLWPDYTCVNICRGWLRGPTNIAVVRSLSHRENNHLVATHHVLTGHQQPGRVLRQGRVRATIGRAMRPRWTTFGLAPTVCRAA